MELFDKVYSSYYNVVRHILKEASEHPITRREMEKLCHSYGFEESALTIIPKLFNGTWPLLKPASCSTRANSYTGRTSSERQQANLHMTHTSSKLQRAASHTGQATAQMQQAYSSVLSSPPPAVPLTFLQKSWIKALLQDSRFCLFFDDEELIQIKRELEDIPALYEQENFHYFDRYRDGDPYASPDYRARFQTILEALRENKILFADYEGKSRRLQHLKVLPCQLQYSSKDDKFRLCCLRYGRSRFNQNTFLNLARIKDCRLSPEGPAEGSEISLQSLRFQPVNKTTIPVLLKISGERNSLERTMLHFANYKKHTEYDEENHCWLCSIYYDTADETELLIDILSFGPVVEVLGPKPFLAKLRARVERQHHLLYDPII